MKTSKAGLYIFLLAFTLSFGMAAKDGDFGSQRRLNYPNYGHDIPDGWNDIRAWLLYDLPNWLSNTANPVIILGASNIRDGVNPGMIASQIDQPTVSMGLSAVTAREISLASRWIVSHLQNPKETVLMLGISYPLVQTKKNRILSGERTVELQKVADAYGCVKLDIDGLQPSCPGWFTNIRAALTRQAINMQFLSWPNQWDQDVNDLKKSFGIYKEPAQEPDYSDTLRPQQIPSKEYQLATFAFWEKYMGDSAYQEEQYSELKGNLQYLVNAGIKTIVIEMPIPTWHFQNSASSREFHSRLMRLTAEVSGIEYVDMTGTLPDIEFRDSLHPSRDIGAAHFSSDLVNVIKRYRSTAK